MNESANAGNVFFRDQCLIDLCNASLIQKKVLHNSICCKQSLALLKYGRIAQKGKESDLEDKCSCAFDT